MGDNQASLRGFPSPRKRSDGDDGDEGARATQARLKVVDRAQQLLRTVDVERLIPEDHPARAIWEFVGRLDLSGYTDQVRSVAGGAGRPAFDPQLLVSLWVYSYSQSVSSARAIERLCEHHPAYQWLTGMQSISAHTLSDFRVTHAQALHELFVQTLGLLSADGLITLERVMLDGTKVRANASSDRFRSKPRVEEFLKDAREAVEALEAQTEEESSRQMQAAKQRARREKQERLESALKEYAKLEAAKSRVKRVSTTDPDARVMKQAEGGSAPSYNVQVSTDAAHGLIVDIDATQAGSDYRQLTPAIERIEQSMQRAPEQMVVDVFRFSWNMTVLKLKYAHGKRSCHEQRSSSSHCGAKGRAVAPARCREKAGLGGMQRGRNPAEPVLHMAKGAIGWSPYGVFVPSCAEP